MSLTENRVKIIEEKNNAYYLRRYGLTKKEFKENIK